jgi:hypothetical protein
MWNEQEKKWKLTFYEEVHANSAEEMAATWILGGKHIINPSEALIDKSESDTWTSHGSMSPPGTQTAKDVWHAQRMDKRAHIPAIVRGSTTGRVAWEDRPILRSADPTLCPLILAFHVLVPH